MTRDDALKILTELKNSPNMVKHGLAVGFAMAAFYDYFNKKNKKPELSKDDWEIVGLLHDADYEITNKSLEKHTDETVKRLNKLGVRPLIIDAIRGHCDKESRKTFMAKSVYACDELTGIIVANALVKPDKKLKSVTVESNLRKLKDKSFAANVNRDQIKTCETELNIPLEEFVAITLKAMQSKSKQLGL